ncbi:MAG TPA: TlpA disulfide reductase family protein [Pyrinomonadaceae bacterium]|nr:TlpA disulfide reductase family protein [Pyrinomonadaceae bacterium]
MGMRIGTEMPRLDGATEWFGGTQAHAEAEAKGHPTLVHFWSMSCGTCKDNMPRIAEWRDNLKARGLRVIAVHMPRYEADTDVDAVREAIAANTITEACAIDNEHKLKEAFGNDQGYVPAYYLFDGEGKLRSFAAGERGLDLLKSTLDRVLNAHEAKVNSLECGDPSPLSPTDSMAPRS